VEFYFSDANILKDKFLLKHVKKNKEGYVKIKLISSFKKMLKLTKNWYQVAYALKHNSTKLDVNAECTKCKRRESLPSEDNTASGLRTAIVTNLRPGELNVDFIKSTLCKFGQVTLVRIINGKNIPQDVQEFFVSNKPKTPIGNASFALVEFQSEDQVTAAVNVYADNWRGMQVQPLIQPKEKKQIQRQRKESEPTTEQTQQVKEAAKNQRKKQKQRLTENETAPMDMAGRRRTVSRTSQLSESCPSDVISSSPSWLQQRRAFMSNLGTSPATTEGTSPLNRILRGDNGLVNGVVPTGILRLPRGPDGSPGFRPRDGFRTEFELPRIVVAAS